MQRGVVISGIGHGALILVAMFGLPDYQAESTLRPPQVSDVSLISLEEFQAAQSDAPAAPGDLTTALTAPREDTIKSPEPVTDPTLAKSQADAPDAPSAETAPDASGLAVTNPDVAVDLNLPQADIDTGALGTDSPLINAAPRDGSINSTQTALLAPTRPNLAPRIDTTAAAAPESDAKEADQVETATAPAPSPEPPKEQAEEAAPKEATTEISPDATVQDRPTTPATAARPRGRPKVRPAQTEQARKPAPEATPAPAATVAATPAATPAPTQTPAAPGGTRLGQDFNSGERQALGDAIGGFWNKAPILGKEGFEKLVVVVRIRLRADGTPIGGVEPVVPKDPSGDFRVAFRQARTAVLRAAAKGLPLPRDKFRDGDYLEIRFDPSRDAISLR